MAGTWSCRRAGPLGRVAPARLLRRALPRARAAGEPPLRRRQAASRALRTAGVPALPQAPRADAVALAGPRGRDPGILRGTYPYHLALLQLEHDASFRDHGPFASRRNSSRRSSPAFAAGAPAHHHLVFKAHPLEDGRAPLLAEHPAGRAQRRHRRPGAFRARREARAAARRREIGGHRELHRRAAGALARTSAQVLRGRVYRKPEFVSDQPLTEFFSAPRATR
jgi:hypothetical protein